MNNTVNIYVILLNDEEVYVGYTRNLNERWIQYKSSYNCEHSHTHQEHMTQHMKIHGWYNFTIQLVEEHVDKVYVNDHVEEWIEAYKEIGCDIINKSRTKGNARKTRENCAKCGLDINSRDRARHQATMRCQLLHRGFGALPLP